MAGKNKIERGFRFLWDGKDLSGDLVPGSVSGGGMVLDEVDMTGVSETVRNYLAGHATAAISARFHMNDDTDRSFDVLAGAEGTIKTIALQYGSNGAAPTSGDPQWSGSYVFLGFRVVVDGGKMVMECSWQPGSSTPPAWSTIT